METVNFKSLQRRYGEYVAREIVTKSMMTSFLWKFIFPDKKARYFGCNRLFSTMVSTSADDTGFILTKMQKEMELNQEEQIIGYIRISSNTNSNTPSNSTDRNTENQYSISNNILFTLLAPIRFGFGAVWRYFVVYKLKQETAKPMHKYFVDFWRFDLLCIHQSYHGKGFGSKLLRLAHQYCIHKNKNIPIFLTTTDPIKVHFYKNHGYRVISKVIIDSQRSNFGLLYHHDRQSLEESVNAMLMDKTVPFERKLSFKQDFLPQTWLQWIRSVIIFVILSTINLVLALVCRQRFYF